jgi:hypothetical protein
MWRRSWLLPLLGAGLLAVLLPVLAGCNNPSTSSVPRERPAAPAEKDDTKKPADAGGIKPPPRDPG